MTLLRVQAPDARVFKGTFLSPRGSADSESGGSASGVSRLRALADVDVFDPGWLSVGPDGRILALTRDCPKDVRHVVDFGDALVMPGFVDTHTHLPQYAFTGLGDLPLLPWLETYTFPHERAFCDPTLARARARHFFQACLAMGTTTVMACGTHHEEAVHIAFEEARSAGIRAGIGLVLMDSNVPDDFATESGKSLVAAERLASCWDRAGSGRLRFVVTPRFAVSCTQGLMEGAADLAQRRGLLVQTHLAENNDEIALVRELFPKAESSPMSTILAGF